MNAAQTKEDCLDQIEYKLVGNTSELAENCRKRLEELRNELKKSSKNLDTEMNWKIATLMSAVEMLSKGFTPSLEWENKKNPVFSTSVSNQVKSDMHTTSNGATLNNQTIEQLIGEAIKNLEKTKEKDIDESRKIIDIIESSFEAYNYPSQEFDLKLAEVQYILMGKYLQNGREKEAAEYAKKFKTDMAIYVKQRMIKKIEEASINASIETFAALSNYLATDEIDVTDIKLWKTMTEIETGKKLEIIEDVQKIESENTKKEKKPKKEKIKVDREDKKKYDVIVIRCDKKIPGAAKARDLDRAYDKMYKAYYNNKRKRIKVIFEEGITKIPNKMFDGYRSWWICLSCFRRGRFK